MQYYSALEKEILPFATAWTTLQTITHILSEIGQLQIEKGLHDVTDMWNLKQVKYVEVESRKVVARLGRWAKRGDVGQRGQS